MSGRAAPPMSDPAAYLAHHAARLEVLAAWHDVEDTRRARLDGVRRVGEVQADLRELAGFLRGVAAGLDLGRPGGPRPPAPRCGAPLGATGFTCPLPPGHDAGLHGAPPAPRGA